jgi:hypothetical protein
VHFFESPSVPKQFMNSLIMTSVQTVLPALTAGSSQANALSSFASQGTSPVSGGGAVSLPLSTTPVSVATTPVTAGGVTVSSGLLQPTKATPPATPAARRSAKVMAPCFMAGGLRSDEPECKSSAGGPNPT